MTDELLLWLDLETTGLDEHAGDEIVEIGCILTTEDLIELGEFSSVVTPSTFALSRMMKNEFVMEMHKSNGLLESLHRGDAPQINEAQDRLISFLDGLREPKTLTLAGSGVAQFDIRFVRAQMPRLAERLNYFTIDVGVIRRSHAMWVGRTSVPSMTSRHIAPWTTSGAISMRRARIARCGSQRSARSPAATPSEPSALSNSSKTSSSPKSEPWGLPSIHRSTGTTSTSSGSHMFADSLVGT